MLAPYQGPDKDGCVQEWLKLDSHGSRDAVSFLSAVRFCMSRPVCKPQPFHRIAALVANGNKTVCDKILVCGFLSLDDTESPIKISDLSSLNRLVRARHTGSCLGNP